ncbi:MAG: hypothetical protein HN348_10255, partial [Proteobacteria bacterium]|nr:hypothetical protein [Pseudomonadota bacterium]
PAGLAGNDALLDGMDGGGGFADDTPILNAAANSGSGDNPDDWSKEPSDTELMVPALSGAKSFFGVSPKIERGGLADTMGVPAVALGNSVFFGTDVVPDEELVVHEMAHIKQKQGGSAAPADGDENKASGGPTDIEAEADAAVQGYKKGEKTRLSPDVPSVPRTFGVPQPLLLHQHNQRLARENARKRKEREVGGSTWQNKITEKISKKTAAASMQHTPAQWSVSAQILQYAVITRCLPAASKPLSALLVLVKGQATPAHSKITELMDECLAKAQVDTPRYPKLLPRNIAAARAVRNSWTDWSRRALPGQMVRATRSSVFINELLKGITPIEAHKAQENVDKIREIAQIAKDEKAEMLTIPGRIRIATTDKKTKAHVERVGVQNLHVKVSRNKFEIYSIMPKVRKLFETKRTPDAKSSTDANKVPKASQDELKKLTTAWLESRPGLPSCNVDFPTLNVSHNFVNDKFWQAVKEYYDNPSKTDKILNVVSNVVIFVGGALTILGFWFPPAAAVGSAMIALATAYQLPQIVMHPLSEVYGGYRNFGVSDLFNAAGLLSTLVGLPGSAAPKATAKLSARAASAAEKNIALKYTGKALNGVVKFSNAVSDYWGMWLGSAAAVNGVAKMIDGKCTSVEDYMLTALDILNGGVAMVSGASGRLDAKQNASVAKTKAAGGAKNTSPGQSPGGNQGTPGQSPGGNQGTPGQSPGGNTPGQSPGGTGGGNTPGQKPSGPSGNKGPGGSKTSVSTSGPKGTKNQTGNQIKKQADPKFSAREGKEQLLAPVKTLKSWVEKEQLKGINWSGKYGYRPESAKHVNSPGCYKSESMKAAFNSFIAKYGVMTKQLRVAGIRWNKEERRTEIMGLKPTAIKVPSPNKYLQGGEDELKAFVADMLGTAEGQVNRIIDVEAFGIANAAKSVPMETTIQSFYTTVGKPIMLGALKQHIGYPMPPTLRKQHPR